MNKFKFKGWIKEPEKIKKTTLNKIISAAEKMIIEKGLSNQNCYFILDDKFDNYCVRVFVNGNGSKMRLKMSRVLLDHNNILDAYLSIY